MAESPVRQLKEIGREGLDPVIAEFLKTLKALTLLGSVSLDEQAQAVEHIGRRLRDACCGDQLRGHAILANQILTIATTRMA